MTQKVNKFQIQKNNFKTVFQSGTRGEINNKRKRKRKRRYSLQN